MKRLKFYVHFEWISLLRVWCSGVWLYRNSDTSLHTETKRKFQFRDRQNSIRDKYEIWVWRLAESRYLFQLFHLSLNLYFLFVSLQEKNNESEWFAIWQLTAERYGYKDEKKEGCKWDKKKYGFNDNKLIFLLAMTWVWQHWQQTANWERDRKIYKLKKDTGLETVKKLSSI